MSREEFWMYNFMWYIKDSNMRLMSSSEMERLRSEAIKWANAAIHSVYSI